MKHNFQIETDRTLVTLNGLALDRRYLDFSKRNRGHLEAWEAKRDADYFTMDSARKRIACVLKQYQRGTALPLVALDNQSGDIIATCNVSQIVRGIFQAGYLGYSVDKLFQGHGYMTEILTQALPVIFDELNLHRLIAAYMPENIRSERLLKGLGFVDEGVAKSYLCINGHWRDHRVSSLINPNA